MLVASLREAATLAEPADGLLLLGLQSSSSSEGSAQDVECRGRTLLALLNTLLAELLKESGLHLNWTSFAISFGSREEFRIPVHRCGAAAVFTLATSGRLHSISAGRVELRMRRSSRIYR